MPTPDARRTVHAGGHDLALTDVGEGPEAVLLVHGIGVSWRYFRPLVAELTATSRVLAPDVVGFGASARPRAVLTIPEHAAVLADLLDVLGLRHVVVLGHSLGAQVATELAVIRPDLVGGLVLVGPVIEPGARSRLRQAWRLARDTRHETPRTNAIMVTDWLRGGPRRYARTLPTMFAYRLEDRLPLVTAPVTLVRGASDPVAPLDHLTHLADRTGARVVEVGGSGHIAQWRRPAELAAICRSVRC